MTIRYIAVLSAVMLICAPGACLAQGNPAGQPPNIVLSPADQLILQSINKINDRLDRMSSEFNARMDQMSSEFNARMDQMSSEFNGRIDQVNGRIDLVNGRIDNLWIAMIGGFIGVMGFIGALVFWDRRTFISRAREGLRMEMAHDRNCIQGLLAAMKALSEQFPQVRQALAGFGLV